AGVFAISFLGSASKETFIPAALLASVGVGLLPRERLAAVPAAAEATPGGRWNAVLATLLGSIAYVGVRACVLPSTGASLGQNGNPFASASGWLFIPKLIATAS